MPTIIFFGPTGTETAVQGEVGMSAMRAATENGVVGIDAICGGQCACATCHCYVDDEWISRLAPIEEMEDEMLDDVLAERRPNSRLACQLIITHELDGLILHLPAQQ